MVDSVCSPGFSKKLKKYGAPNISRYCWVSGILKKRNSSDRNAIPAYKGDEIFDIFPDYISYPGTVYRSEFDRTADGYWRVWFSDGTYTLNNYVVNGLTYSDAIAEMIIYLIEQELWGYD